MFTRIAEEDRPYYDEGVEIPTLGRSNSDYETCVGPFYNFWLNYCSPRSFVWAEKHDTRDAQDRYVRRQMEKENKKLRDKAKKERNEEVRQIVALVRKKDKRVEAYKAVKFIFVDGFIFKLYLFSNSGFGGKNCAEPEEGGRTSRGRST